MKRNEYLKTMIKVKGVSYRDIAEVLGVHPNSICNWMNSNDKDKLNKIMDAISQLSDDETSILSQFTTEELEAELNRRKEVSK